MQSIEDWSDLAVFAAVVRAGSLVAAGQALHMNHSTVFRRVRRLEEQLGAELLHREGRRYTPTAVGTDVHEIATLVGDQITALERRVMGADAELAGDVAFTTVAEIMRLLRPHLSAFRDAYPQIKLSARIETRKVSLSNREADVAIRAGTRPDDPDLAGRRVGMLRFAGFASRDYLQDRRAPCDAHDLSHLDWIGLEQPARAAPDRLGLQQWLDGHVTQAQLVYRSDSIEGQLEGVLANLGAALLPVPVGRAHPQLVELFETEVAGELWIIWHRDLRRTARVRAFSSFVGEALQRELSAVGE